jgi:hypothetical protein
LDADPFSQGLSVRARINPSTRSEPLSGRRRPSQHSIVVVFPAPFGPTMPKISPCPTANVTPSTAATLP